MADLVRTHDLTDASQHGWAVDYLIQREDGAELHVEVRCWDRAREAADKASNEGTSRLAGVTWRRDDLDLVRPGRRRPAARAGQLRAIRAVASGHQVQRWP